MQKLAKFSRVFHHDQVEFSSGMNIRKPTMDGVG